MDPLQPLEMAATVLAENPLDFWCRICKAHLWDEKDMHQLGIMKQSPIVGSRKVLFKRKGYSLSVFVTEVVLGTYQSGGRFFCKRTDDYFPVAMTGERTAANSCHAGKRHRSSADCTRWGDHCNNTTPLCLERQFNPPMPSPPKKKGLI